MKMVLQDVEEILFKYRNEEEKTQQLLLEKTGDLNEVRIASKGGKNRGIAWKIATFNEAKERNKALLKELEIVKGNLRSKAIFSPTEMQWEKICRKYQEEPCLQVTTWKCNQHVFV